MGCFGGQRIPVPTYQEPFKMPDFPSFGGISMEAPQMPPMPEMPQAPTFDPNAAAERQRAAEELVKLREVEARRRGYRSTMLTGGAGDTTTPNLRTPSLLGS